MRIYGKSLVIADADRPVEGTLQTMSPCGALDAKTRRERLCGTDATAGLFHVDPAKVLVMTHVRRLIVWLCRMGYARERRYSAKFSNS